MHLAAALIFFTRLPLWRWVQPPREAYARVVPYWALTGWLTAALTAGVLYVAAQLLPPVAAVGLAVAARVLLTGGLHEDGLADFFDGFGGGGNDRVRILAIMKDSHIGTCGVIALILYFLLYVTLLSALPVGLACAAILCGDPLARGVASQLVNVLPYARPQEESKSKVVYNRMSWPEGLLSGICALLPFFLLFDLRYGWALLAPLAVFAGLWGGMRRRIGGYTGDCCGALCLLGEFSFYLMVVVLWNLS